MVFGLTDNTDVHAHILTHASEHYLYVLSARAHTHTHTPGRAYSKRFNGLINNASTLHVYAIYRARPSDGEPARS